MEVEEIIAKSGYPLQLAVEKSINSTYDQHGWSVVAKEHHWSDKYGNEGYIDLILDHKRYKVRAIIECKKIQGSWNFLIPEVNPLPSHKSILLRTSYADRSMSWVSSPIMNQILESSYCVSEVGRQQDKRTLEQISGELLLAVEAQAREEIDIYPYDQPKDRELFYIPIIVAAVILQKVIFDPKNVNIDDGTLQNSTIDEISYIRFRKSLASNIPPVNSPYAMVEDISKANERAVFVVQSASIVDFLNLLNTSIECE